MCLVERLQGDFSGAGMQHGGMSRRALITVCYASVIFTYFTSFFKPFSSIAVSSRRQGK
jgi:hypothetical protein